MAERRLKTLAGTKSAAPETWLKLLMKNQVLSVIDLFCGKSRNDLFYKIALSPTREMPVVFYFQQGVNQA